MGAKQIVFSGEHAAVSSSAFSSKFSNLSTFDYIMVVLLLALVAVSVYYIATTQRTMHKVEGFASNNGNNMYKVVYIYMNGCPYCVKFDKTYADVSGDVEITKRFVIEEKIEIKSASADKYKDYKCDGFPCYLVLDAKSDKLVAQGTGYRSPSDWKSWLLSY